MITGQVNANRDAVIQLEVGDLNAGATHFAVVIDTGFSEYLTLPPDQIAALGLSYRTSTQVILADGTIVALKVYSANVVWDGKPRQVSVHEADGAPLIGMAMLYGYRLTIDAVDGGAVIITALP
jgi:clan AA aspartic protease